MKKILLTILAILCGTATAQSQSSWQALQPRRANSIAAMGGSCTVPDAPTGLAVAQILWDQLDLTWTDNSSDEDNFSILRCTGSACTPSVELDTAVADATSYDDTSITQGTIHGYAVVAQNACGDSDPTSTVYATPTYLYGYPAAQTAAKTGTAVAQFDFSESSGNITDEVASVVLTVTGSPTYSVAATGEWAGVSTGITTGSGKHFHKTTASSSLNIGATDDITYELIYSSVATTGNHYGWSTLPNGPGAGAYSLFNPDASPLLGLVVLDDNGNAFNISMSLAGLDFNDGNPHKILQWVDRDAAQGLEYWWDGTSLGTSDQNAQILGHTVTNAVINMGSLYDNGTGPFVGTLFEWRQTNALVSSGGPGE